MSIELKIEALTAAINALTVQVSAIVNDANFGKIAAPSTQASTAAVAGATEEKPKRTRTTKAAETKPVETEVEGFDDVVASIDAATAAGSDDLDLGLEEEAAPEVTQADLKTVVSDVSKKKGRETVLRLFKDFSVATFGDVKPEQYGKMYAAAKELLG